MALVTGKIGLEDLALGFGEEVQDLGNSRTRTITKINAGVMPFGPGVTLRQALETLTNLLQSEKATSIANNSSKIEALAGVLTSIQYLASNLDLLKDLHNKEDLFATLNDNIIAIKLLQTDISKLTSQQATLLHIESETKAASSKASEAERKIVALYEQTIYPLACSIQETLDNVRVMVQSAKEEVQSGQEIVTKFGTYELKISIRPSCKQPYLAINDTAKTITWYLPRPICATQYNVDQEIMNSAISSYLVSHPIQSGTDEARVNQLIADYATAHPSTNVTDEHITELAKAYHDEHQVVVQQYPLVPEDQLEGE